jgi:hypothetical protein
MNTIHFPRLALACLLALAGAATAMAQTADTDRARKMGAELEKRFAAADANHDGRLTKEEAKGKMPMVYQHFDEIDAAHAGSVSLAEIVRFAQAHRGARKTAP